MVRRDGEWLWAGLCAIALACEPSKQVDVAAAPPVGRCQVSVTPPSVDDGMVELGSVTTTLITLQNTGAKTCELAGVNLDSASDLEFTLTGAVPAPPFPPTPLVPGAQLQLTVTFTASSRAAPHLRTGTVLIDSDDPVNPNQEVPLQADVDLGCDLQVIPNPLTFGNLDLNVVVTNSLTLTNDGTRDCSIANLALAAGTDVDFTLATDQLTAFDLVPGQSAAVPVTFTASNPPPNLRTGAVNFSLTSAQNAVAMETVPLQGFIDTDCNSSASSAIFVVEEDGTFASFDPNTLRYTNITQLNCPGAQSPFSMAVDQHAIAWVEDLGGNIFRVDASNGACTATSFTPGQLGFDTFGMGFLFDPLTGLDTLYIAGGTFLNAGPTELGTISFPDLVVHDIGPVAIGWPELTGTGDGQLWGFVPAEGSSTGVAEVAQIDPATGAAIQEWVYPEITEQGGWAMKFFGGDFWIFIGNSVYAVSRDTAALRLALNGTSPEVVGAGVSTCAPLH